MKRKYHYDWFGESRYLVRWFPGGSMIALVRRDTRRGWDAIRSGDTTHGRGRTRDAAVDDLLRVVRKGAA